MKIFHWLIIVALVFMVLAISLDFMREIILGNFTFLPAIAIALIAVTIVALLKMQKSWIIAAIASNMILFGINIKLIMEYQQTYSISVTIITVTVGYLLFGLKKAKN